MLTSWAKAYADRWGLPEPAARELREVIDAVAHGRIAPSSAPTLAILGARDETPAPAEGRRLIPVLTGDVSERYEDLGEIATGGMGEVRRVWDYTLNRSLAMKILRRDLVDREDLLARFKEEAEATAQLEHPAIVPIHDFGHLPDGRAYFTMREIQGRTLLDVIDDVHAVSIDAWETSPSGWSLLRLVQAFHQVCEAVAYAHSRNVLHRDLKPTNIMVGAFGEVVVMDWGLAKVAHLPASRHGASRPPVRTERASSQAWETRHGDVAGTPSYMPPEQARGEHGKVGPWSDVYALGAILYHMLSDRPPFDDPDQSEVIRAVLEGPPPPPGARNSRGAGPPVDPGLAAICTRALARDLAARYGDAASLAEAVAAWLDGARLQEQARGMLAQVDALEPRARVLRDEAAELRAEAWRLRTATDEDARDAAMATEHLARDTERDLASLRRRQVSLLEAALSHAPELPEARSRLDVLLGRVAGPALLSLAIDPSVEVLARRWDTSGPGWSLGPPQPLGSTPFSAITLPSGSWSLSFGPHVLPIVLEPGVHLRPTDAANDPVLLLPPEVGPGERWIASGWVTLGADGDADDTLPRRRVFVPGFVCAVDPVTVGAYASFLEDALRSGDRHLAERLCPRRSDGAAVWDVAHGAVRLPPEAWLDAPIRSVPWEGACAYAEWLADRSGLPWRLPTELEWEKAARGADERRYPWGAEADPRRARVLDAARSDGRSGGQPGSIGPSSVGADPDDVSPWGVRGLGGNVRDWVVAADPSTAPASTAPGASQRDVPVHLRIARGGWFGGAPNQARSVARHHLAWPVHPGVGFRLVRPVRDTTT